MGFNGAVHPGKVRATLGNARAAVWPNRDITAVGVAGVSFYTAVNVGQFVQARLGICTGHPVMATIATIATLAGSLALSWEVADGICDISRRMSNLNRAMNYPLARWPREFDTVIPMRAAVVTGFVLFACLGGGGHSFSPSNVRHIGAFARRKVSQTKNNLGYPVSSRHSTSGLSSCIS